MPFTVGKNPVVFNCRRCNVKLKQRRSFHEQQIGTVREGLCLECIMATSNVESFDVTLSGKVTPRFKGGK